MNDKLTNQITKKFLDLIVDRYLQSRDFNGFPVVELIESNLSKKTVYALLATHLKDGKITLAFGGNPHIKAFPALSLREQEAHLKKYSLSEICVYPSPNILSKRVDTRPLHDKPYTRELMLGAGQLETRYFLPEVLERYTKNPAYEVYSDGTSGKISTINEYVQDDKCSKDDQVYLDFGYGYSNDEHKKQLVIAFPRYLHSLPPRHQLHWYSHKADDGLIDSDFLARSYKGEFTENCSVYDAVLQQMREINRLLSMIGMPNLFKNTFDDGVPDDRYAPIKRMTLQEFNGFALILRKIVLDNMSMDFFKQFININELGVDIKGKEISKNKSTTRMLFEWFQTIKYKPVNETIIPSIIDPLVKLNKKRGSEAHSIKKNDVGLKWLDEQKNLVKEVFYSLEGLRLILSSHPKAKQYKAPEWLDEMMIKY